MALLARFPPERDRRASASGARSGTGRLRPDRLIDGLLVEDGRLALIFLVILPIGASSCSSVAGALIEGRTARGDRPADLLGSGRCRRSRRAGADHRRRPGVGLAGTAGSSARSPFPRRSWRCSSGGARAHPSPVVDPHCYGSRASAGRPRPLPVLGRLLLDDPRQDILFLHRGVALLDPEGRPDGHAGPLAGRHRRRAGRPARRPVRPSRADHPGALFYAVDLLVLRTTGARPDFVATWLPGRFSSALGIGLASRPSAPPPFQHVGPDRFGSASAVASRFRQFAPSSARDGHRHHRPTRRPWRRPSTSPMRPTRSASWRRCFSGSSRSRCDRSLVGPPAQPSEPARLMDSTAHAS